MGSSKLKLLFPLLLVIVAAAFTSGIPGVHAWNLSVDPPNQNTGPGGKVIYTVSLLYDRSEGTPFPVQLLVDPPIQGLTVDFSPNNREVPFTSTMTVQVGASVSPGSYNIHIWAHKPYSRFPGPDDKETTAGLVISPIYTVFTTPTLSPRTNWALSNPDFSPHSPRIDDSITFRVTLAALSTDSPYPQVVRVRSFIDGHALSSTSQMTYAGPTGAPLQVEVKMPAGWLSSVIAETGATTPLVGPHEFIAIADPEELGVQYNDPDRTNNVATLRFELGAALSTTTKQTGPSTLPTVTMQPRTTSSTPVEQRSGSDDDMWLLSIFGFAAFILLLIAVFRRKSRVRRTPRLETSARYCINCGRPLTATGAFCVSCGAQQNTS